MNQTIAPAYYKNEWKKLKDDLIQERFTDFPLQYEKLGHYDLVELYVDEKGAPLLTKANEQEVPSYLAFTKPELLSRALRARPYNQIKTSPPQSPIELEQDNRLKTFMLGDLVHTLSDNKRPMGVKINPILVEDGALQRYVAEEMIVIPLMDEVTHKHLICDPQEALALLAIQAQDQHRLGMEMVFYSITNKLLPGLKEEREPILRDKIDELAFLCPRVPLKRGSGAFICVLLNLENPMEEAAFIRNYKTLDEHTDIIFVTSELEILTGHLEKIPYNGNSIDTIFLPLIQWQKEQFKKRKII